MSSCSDIALDITSLLGEFTIKKIHERTVNYFCDCSRTRLGGVILTLGRGEIFNILSETGKIEFTCDFCRKQYIFYKDEVIALLNPVVN